MTEERRQQTGVEVKLEFIIKELDEIKAKLEKNYVSQEAFIPVKNTVYGLVSLILITVFGAFLRIVISN